MERKYRESVSELQCQLCPADYAVWHCENELWNQVLGNDSIRIHFLCPTCFTMLAEHKKIIPIRWKLSAEFRC